MSGPEDLYPPFARWHAPVTPSDVTVLPIFWGIWVGGAGSVTIRQNGVDCTYAAVPAGTMLRVAGTQVRATGTTATLMIAVVGQ